MSEASPPTLETLEVKRRGRHRLIGAITLALMLVVFVPMILDSDPRRAVPAPEVPLAIPPKDGLPPLPAPVAHPPKAEPGPESKVESRLEAKATEATPVAPAVAEAKPGSMAVKSSDGPTTAPKEAKPAAVPAKVPVKAADKVTEPEKKATKAAEKLEGFAIQLGAFSEAEKVTALKAKMKSAKIPVFTEAVSAANGKLTRLRAGPYKTREQAEKALVQVKKQGVDGKIVPLP